MKLTYRSGPIEISHNYIGSDYHHILSPVEITYNLEEIKLSFRNTFGFYVTPEFLYFKIRYSYSEFTRIEIYR